MEEALSTTKVINWNEPINVVFASSEVDECFKRLSVRFGLKIQGERAVKHVLYRNSALLDNIWWVLRSIIVLYKLQYYILKKKLENKRLFFD